MSTPATKIEVVEAQVYAKAIFFLISTFLASLGPGDPTALGGDRDMAELMAGIGHWEDTGAEPDPAAIDKLRPFVFSIDGPGVLLSTALPFDVAVPSLARTSESGATVRGGWGKSTTLVLTQIPSDLKVAPLRVVWLDRGVDGEVVLDFASFQKIQRDMG